MNIVEITGFFFPSVGPEKTVQDNGLNQASFPRVLNNRKWLVCFVSRWRMICGDPYISVTLKGNETCSPQVACSDKLYRLCLWQYEIFVEKGMRFGKRGKKDLAHESIINSEIFPSETLATT